MMETKPEVNEPQPETPLSQKTVFKVLQLITLLQSWEEEKKKADEHQ
jgi:hypothetical protein